MHDNGPWEVLDSRNITEVQDNTQKDSGDDRDTFQAKVKDDELKHMWDYFTIFKTGSIDLVKLEYLEY